MATATETFPITKAFVLAGNATFTVHNPTGTHYTYRVTKAENEGLPAAWFVGLLAGPDNDGDYTYLGLLAPQEGVVRLTKASKLGEEATAVKVIRWAIKRVWQEREMPEGYGIHGEGRCGRCGRTLTAPDGIAPEGYRLGFGPTCWDKMQAERASEGVPARSANPFTPLNPKLSSASAQGGDGIDTVLAGHSA